jgi:hypothetical protein
MRVSTPCFEGFRELMFAVDGTFTGQHNTD